MVNNSQALSSHSAEFSWPTRPMNKKKEMQIGINNNYNNLKTLLAHKQCHSPSHQLTLRANKLSEISDGEQVLKWSAANTGRHKRLH